MKDLLQTKSLNKEWFRALKTELSKDYFKDLVAFLKEEIENKEVFPEPKNCFAAFNATPLSEVKVVLLGQDPYHGEGQAHGLSFSVPQGVKVPPSLRNIFKELSTSFPEKSFTSGDLGPWAKQGVFLLNSVLTVEKGMAASHKKKGWEIFTDQVLNILNEQPQAIVFLLWGSYAHKKAYFLSNKNHLILKASHPSPLSAHRGFLGCGHFQKAQDFLVKQGQSPINWGL